MVVVPPPELLVQFGYVPVNPAAQVGAVSPLITTYPAKFCPGATGVVIAGEFVTLIVVPVVVVFFVPVCHTGHGGVLGVLKHGLALV